MTAREAAAAVGGQRGRVVLHLTSAAPSPVALDAAMRIAQAFQSELESLLVEDQGLLDVAGFPFAKEISLTGRRVEALSPERIAQQMRHVAAALQRQVAELARRAEVPMRATIVRDEPVSAVARACADCGPWNVIALADPLSPGQSAVLRRLFAAASGATGVVVVGRDARRTMGPVVVAVEEMGRLEPMLRAGERLLTVSGSDQIRLVLVGQSEEETLEMEGQARLVMGSEPAATIVRASARHGSPISVAEVLRKARGSFVMAQFGGFLAPADSDLRHLITALECPLLLVR